ncbi:MAG: methylated-DNA--[protein]-cysteine S-methyltransferase, partial [Hymenobacter sp.]|nr:methylated-DNA--[protein]-cysteine S-methyltransferase [Hymenobacter sp.]
AAGLDIRYGFHPTPFGECLLSLTDRGICGLTFQASTEQAAAVQALHQQWPCARLRSAPAETGPVVQQLFAPTAASKPLALLLKGTNFQIKVWEALLRIPPGQVVSYAAVAAAVGRPGASQAVGGAVGANAIGYLIPCHRVIQQHGGLGGYRWGETRKQALLGWEAAKADENMPADREVVLELAG